MVTIFIEKVKGCYFYLLDLVVGSENNSKSPVVEDSSDNETTKKAQLHLLVQERGSAVMESAVSLPGIKRPPPPQTDHVIKNNTKSHVVEDSSDNETTKKAQLHLLVQVERGSVVMESAVSLPGIKRPPPPQTDHVIKNNTKSPVVEDSSDNETTKKVQLHLLVQERGCAVMESAVSLPGIKKPPSPQTNHVIKNNTKSPVVEDSSDNETTKKAQLHLLVQETGSAVMESAVSLPGIERPPPPQTD